MTSAREGRTEDESRYTRTAIILHWLIAVWLFGQIIFGWYLEEIPRGTPARAWYVNLHKSSGMTLGVVIFFRLFWRWTHRPPPLPYSLPEWERTGARVTHALLYACMLIMPLSGYIASNFSEWGVKYFNAISLPPWGVDDPRIYTFLHDIHDVTSVVFVTLIVVHAIGAVRHAVLKDGIFQRMWPARLSRSPTRKQH